MPQQKDAAWWREYRARRRAQHEALDRETMPSVGRQDAAPLGVAAADEAGPRGLPQADDEYRLSSRPTFLAAPDDDCVCGHDRHAYHLGGGCNAYVGRKRCPCSGFMADLGFE